jgi:hypothetical protein
MNIGTRSVLYGAHCAILHPWFLAVAWWKLYGFPWDVRLWAAFWLHDIGYFSKRDMDGADGETHVELGARIMALFFGESWGAFTAAHSRYWAKRHGTTILPPLRGRQTGVRADTGLVVSANGEGDGRTRRVHVAGQRATGGQRTFYGSGIRATEFTGCAGMAERSKELHATVDRRA